MYAEKFILIPRKTYAPNEKTVPQSQVFHNPSIYDKSSQLIFLQRFPERSASRDYPPPKNATTPIPLTPNNFVPNPRKRNLSALTNFSGEGDDEAEKKMKPTIRCGKQLRSYKKRRRKN